MGFGRIGRNVFRLVHNRDDLDVVAISDIADPKALTYLLKYDSIYGRFPMELSHSDDVLSYGSKTAAFLNAREPGEADWSAHDVDVVLETTSKYRSVEWLKKHLDAGARKVVLTSSPETPGEMPLLLRGVNDSVLTPTVDMVALGSNTSNAIAPVLKTLNESFGIDRAFMTTVKAMSNAGRLADVPTDDFRTSRAAGENIIPATTNSAEILSDALPEFQGKLSAVALNVPVTDGSTVDLVAQVASTPSVEEVNEAMRSAIADRYQGVMAYVDDPIVSSDVRDESHSGVFDSLATMVTGENLVKTITWFNNGWAYSNRAVEVAATVAEFLEGEQS
jgi:glyceraldehyde 3-phosphate dehydrogenase